MPGCSAAELSVFLPLDLPTSIAQGEQIPFLFDPAYMCRMLLLYLHGIDQCTGNIVTPAFSFPSSLGTLEGQECTNALNISEFSLPDLTVNP